MPNFHAQTPRPTREILEGWLKELDSFLVTIVHGEVGTDLRAKEGNSDVAQEARLEAYAHLDSFPRTTFEEFKAWLRAVVRNKVRGLANHHKAQKRQPPGGVADLEGEPAAHTGVSTAVLRHEKSGKLREALLELPLDTLALILLRYHDVPFARIGKKFDITENAASQRWLAALAKLERAMNPPESPAP